MKTIIRCLPLLSGALLVCGSLSAQPAQPAPVDDTRAYFEALRSQFNTDKVGVYNRVLKLTAPEADKFWPVYRDYERELATLADQKLALVRDFFTRQDAGKLSDKDSTVIAEKWLANVQARLDLWKKYHQRISKEVSPTRAAQFLQLENQIALFLDISIASEMPEIKPANAANTGK
jgi:hypothetical protein